jgi:hypothetical protein
MPTSFVMAISDLPITYEFARVAADVQKIADIGRAFVAVGAGNRRNE